LEIIHEGGWEKEPGKGNSRKKGGPSKGRGKPPSAKEINNVGSRSKRNTFPGGVEKVQRGKEGTGQEAS